MEKTRIDTERETPEQIAQAVLRNCLLRLEAPIDLSRIASKLNIAVVFREEFGSLAKLEGLTLGKMTDKSRTIIIPEGFAKDRRSAPRLNFAVAHELAHFLLPALRLADKDTATQVERLNEQDGEADRFASELLMPLELLKEEWSIISCGPEALERCGDSCPGWSCFKVKRLAEKFGVPIRAMQKKIRDQQEFFQPRIVNFDL